MNHFNEKIIFPTAKPKSKRIVYDITYPSDPEKYDKLLEFCLNVIKLLQEDEYDDWRNFGFMTESAIKANNLKSLETLWQSNSDNNYGPDYDTSLEIAAQYGDLFTFQHCVNAMLIGEYSEADWSGYEGSSGIPIKTLETLASLNQDKDVSKYLAFIKSMFEEYGHDKIKFIGKKEEEEEEEDEDVRQENIDDEMLRNKVFAQTKKFNLKLKR